jgi:hypothetical protein
MCQQLANQFGPLIHKNYTLVTVLLKVVLKLAELLDQDQLVQLDPQGQLDLRVM